MNFMSIDEILWPAKDWAPMKSRFGTYFYSITKYEKHLFYDTTFRFRPKKIAPVYISAVTYRRKLKLIAKWRVSLKWRLKFCWKVGCTTRIYALSTVCHDIPSNKNFIFKFHSSFIRYLIRKVVITCAPTKSAHYMCITCNNNFPHEMLEVMH